MAETYYNAWWNQRRGVDHLLESRFLRELRELILERSARRPEILDRRAFRKEKAPPVTANDLSWHEDPEELTTWAIARTRPHRPDWLFAIDVNLVPSQALLDPSSKRETSRHFHNS